MAAPDFSVTEVVGRGVNFHRANWRRVLGVLLLVTVAGTVQLGASHAGADQLSGWAALIYLPATLMATAALLRLAFQADRPGRPDLAIGPQGVQWGMPEWRLLGASLAVVGVVMLAVLVLAFVLLLFGVVVGLSGAMSALAGADPEQMVERMGPGMAVALLAFLLAFAVGLVWFSVRLSLISPATVALGRMTVFSTLPWTKGRFWKLLGALLLASLPVLTVTILTSSLVEVLGTAAEEDGPKTVALPVGLALGFIEAAVTALIQLPLSAGVSAELYRRLGPGVPASTRAGEQERAGEHEHAER